MNNDEPQFETVEGKVASSTLGIELTKGFANFSLGTDNDDLFLTVQANLADQYGPYPVTLSIHFDDEQTELFMQKIALLREGRNLDAHAELVANLPPSILAAFQEL